MAAPDLLILHSNWMPYNNATATALATSYGVRVTAVVWSSHERTDRRWLDVPGARLIERSTLERADLIDLATSRNWDAIVIAGRMDPDYLAAARAARRRGITTVGGSDEFNRGGLRPMVKRVLRHSLYGRYFDLLWVPGPPQQRWAAKIGYQGRTISNLLSGDTDLFATARTAGTPLVDRNQFLFVGRPVRAKAVDVLLEAFCGSSELRQAGRQLTLIGAEAAEYGAEGRDQVICRPFLPQRDLLTWVASARAFVLPSRWEPWGVVVHEMACAGLPLILSDHVGSSEQFLTAGSNGHIVPAEDVIALRNAMEAISRADGSTLDAMAARSIEASASCSPTLAATALMTALSDRRGGSQPPTERAEPSAEPNQS